MKAKVKKVKQIIRGFQLLRKTWKIAAIVIAARKKKAKPATNGCLQIKMPVNVIVKNNVR